MAFHFPLAAVLRVRAIVEEREERMLQRILFEIAKTLELVARTDGVIAGSDASRRSDVLKPFLGSNFHASYGEVEELKLSRRDLEGKLDKLVQLRDKQLAVYRTARMNREMIADMRDEKRSVYESEMARLEQKAIDDNYISRKGRF